MDNILLVGNPNCGKTTLFNALTKSDEHVGNWHGVTVEEKRKDWKVGEKTYTIVDTPGIYSLAPLSFEEEVSFKIIEKGDYKKIINLCDANNLQRNLYLTLCLLEENCDIVVAINQIDRVQKYRVDEKKLSSYLQVPVHVVDAEKKIGMDNLTKDISANKSGGKLKYLSEIDFSCLDKFFINLPKEERKIYCIKAFERNENYFKLHSYDDEKIKEIFASLPENSMEILAAKRYEFLDEIMKNSCQKTDFVYGKSKLDKVLLNKILAFPCFILIMATIFYLTFFSIGAFLSELLSSFLSFITSPLLSFLSNSLGESFLYFLFSDALLGGVATVLSFLPQVVLLFFFLSVLEDSGYLSRVAFLFEDILGKVGLSGKSIYTLLMGFGCSTTAILTSRNMDNKNSKIKTALLCPYMSCSAKIPIYTVIGGAFFGVNNIFYIIGLYFLGVIVAITISKILDMTLLKSEGQTFILEFPPYRVISLKRVFKVLYKNMKSFLVKIGTVMISMNVIIFLLSSFTFSFEFVQNGEGSMLQKLGEFLAPIFEPLGFSNWAIVSALLAGLVAKEVVVSSIAMFNGIDANAVKLISASILLPTSVVFFTSKASVLSFLVFCLLYTPCLSSISVMTQEIGKRWTAFAVCLQLFVAYVVSFVVYNIAFAIEIFGALLPLLICFGFVLIVSAICVIVHMIKKKKCPYSCKNCAKKCKKS